MKIIKKYKFVFVSILALLAPFYKAHAICPVCTVAVGAGVGLFEYWGIDDVITGIWIGGLVVSMTLWTIDWFNRKNIRFFMKRLVTWVGYYLLIVWPLWGQGYIGKEYNTILGVDKLLFGIIIGSIAFYAGGQLHFFLKKRNGDKVYFPFQKVVFTVAPLLILSGVFYFIDK